MGVTKGGHLLENWGAGVWPRCSPQGQQAGQLDWAEHGRGLGVRGCESLPP